MNVIAELVISVFLVMSGIFGFVGSYGLIKLKDSLQRLHAPTKATTLGVGGVILASLVYFYFATGHVSVHELLISLFLFLTAPITANFIAKAYLAQNVRGEDLPDSSTSYGWSVYDEPPAAMPEAKDI